MGLIVQLPIDRIPAFTPKPSCEIDPKLQDADAEVVSVYSSQLWISDATDYKPTKFIFKISPDTGEILLFSGVSAFPFLAIYRFFWRRRLQFAGNFECFRITREFMVITRFLLR